MNNYNTLYNSNYLSEEETESENETDSENENIFSFNEDKVNINKLDYTNETHSLLVSSLDRDWLDGNTSTFSFKIKFNTSETSLELQKNYSDISKMNVTLNRKLYYGSKELSIPLDIKNIISIHIEKIILPNRKNYLENGSFNNTINLNTILVHIDEFTNVNIGSNQGLNNCFAALTGIGGFDESLNFIEFSNLNDDGKNFKINPLNNLKCLTFSITDDNGNRLQYQNETLNILNLISKNDNFIKITTKEYFSRQNYKEGDIVYFKNFIWNNKILEEFINSKNGHMIYFNDEYSTQKNLNSIEQLINTFYIIKKGKYINGVYTSENMNYPIITDNVSGSIINKNLQLLMKIKIVTKEKNFDFFNPQII